MGVKGRRSRAQVRQLVRDFEKSELSEEAFAKRVGVQRSHLRRWIEREKSPDAAGASVVSVRVRRSTQDSAPQGSDLRVEILLQNGRVVRVPADFDPSRLLELLETLERPC